MIFTLTSSHDQSHRKFTTSSLHVMLIYSSLTISPSPVLLPPENPKMATERVYTVRLQDVNDNHPKLKESQAFICTKGPQPVVLRASDPDSFPFSEPFTFSFPQGKKSPNWEITTVDGTPHHTL